MTPPTPDRETPRPALCPFCKQKPSHVECRDEGRFYVDCYCGARGPEVEADGFDTVAAAPKAIAAWNRRAALAAQDDARDVMRLTGDEGVLKLAAQELSKAGYDELPKALLRLADGARSAGPSLAEVLAEVRRAYRHGALDTHVDPANQSEAADVDADRYIASRRHHLVALTSPASPPPVNMNDEELCETLADDLLKDRARGDFEGRLRYSLRALVTHVRSQGAASPPPLMSSLESGDLLEVIGDAVEILAERVEYDGMIDAALYDAVLEYGRRCILFGVDDEKAFAEAGRPNDWQGDKRRPTTRYHDEARAKLFGLMRLADRGSEAASPPVAAGVPQRRIGEWFDYARELIVDWADARDELNRRPTSDADHNSQTAWKRVVELLLSVEPQDAALAASLPTKLANQCCRVTLEDHRVTVQVLVDNAVDLVLTQNRALRFRNADTPLTVADATGSEDTARRLLAECESWFFYSSTEAERKAMAQKIREFLRIDAARRADEGRDTGVSAPPPSEEGT